MAAIVIDASVASAWCFPDEQTDYTKAVFEAVFSSAVDTVAPGLWAYEIRNSPLMGVRRGRISKTDGEQFLVSLNELSVRLSEPASYDELIDEAGVLIGPVMLTNTVSLSRVRHASIDGNIKWRRARIIGRILSRWWQKPGTDT